VAAQASRGELTGKPMMVFYASAEDAYSQVLKPRLLAAKANLDYIRFVPQLSLPLDIENGRLQETIRTARGGLLIADPLVTYLEATDTWKDQAVKHALTPMLNVAADERCTALGVHHFTKDTKLGALLAGNGSGAFGNTSRVVLAMVRDNDDDNKRILEVVKSNGGPIGVARALRVELVPVPGLTQPQVILVDEGDSAKSADEALAASRQERAPKEKLQAAILEHLATGPKSRDYINQLAKDEFGLSADQTWRHGLAPLKEDGRIKSRKVGFDGGWEWQLCD
jgi:hypothetical protein